jgi:type I restriction enzyme S subunit
MVVRYLYWALQAAPVIAFWEAAVGGATFRALNLGPLAETPTPTWSHDEQQAIAQFLDAKIAGLDALLSALRASVALLAERRRAVIATAVRGDLASSIDHTIHLRPTRIKYLVSSQAGSWGAEPGEAGVDMLCVRAADFDRAKLRVTPDRIPVRSFDFVTARALSLRRGDIILEKSGGGADQPVGATALFDLNVPAVCSNFATRLRSVGGVVPEYLNYLLASLYWTGLTDSLAKQTTGIANLDVGAYLSTDVEVPSTMDQQLIARSLAGELARNDGIIDARRHQIEMLIERRQTLITGAVTGQLEIPGVAV